MFETRNKGIGPKYQKKSAKPNVIYIWLNVYQMKYAVN